MLVLLDTLFRGISIKDRLNENFTNTKSKIFLALNDILREF